MKSSIKARKSMMRKKLRQTLLGMGRAKRRAKSSRVVNRLLKLPEYQKAEKILGYASFGTEVDTLPLLRRAVREKKEVFLPRLSGKSIRIFRVRDLRRDLKTGAFGILEPVRSSRQGKPSELDMILVPGLGFDRKGNRLGRGLGYFDRFLKKAKRARKAALAFGEQIVKKIPCEAHDVRVDLIVTDRGIHEIR